MGRRVWPTILLSILVCAGFGFFVLGRLLYTAPIGLDWTGYPAGAQLETLIRGLGYTGNNAISAVPWVALGLLAVLVVPFWLTRAAVRNRAVAADPQRRRVLTGAATGAVTAIAATATAGGAAALRGFFGVGEGNGGWSGVTRGITGPEVVKTHPEYPEAWKNARIQGTRRLGRTEWPISDIVLGSGRVLGDKGTEIVKLAIDRGVNYVDTSPDYSASGSEEAIGAALIGQRDKVFLATKFCTPWGHLPAGTPVSEYKRIIEESLSRLRTDYVDLVHIHSCDELGRLTDPNAHEAFDRLKEEGKARFLGVSSHTPNLEAVANEAIASDRFDVMMLAYHHGIWPKLPELVHRARSERDMGIIAMKTLKGAKHNGLAGFREEAGSYAQSALRWVLSNEDVSAAVISFFEFQHVDEYLRASGSKLTSGDLAVLEKYDREIVGSYCAPHCGACLDQCPEGVPIHDVLRHRMYFEDYRNEKEAMRLYQALGKNASVCASCSAPCMGSCPVGIPIQDRMVGAHALLTIDGRGIEA